MKTSLSFLVLLISFSSHAQFAIITDKDGFVNVRHEGSASAKIIDTLKNDHLVYFFEAAGNWANIDYSKKKTDKSGYIYVDRFAFISRYSKIPVSKQTSNTIILSKDSIEITVAEQPFNKAKHTFKYTKDNNTIIELVDGKIYYGCDGGIPKKQYKKIVVKTGQTTIALPKAAIENLFEPSLSNTQVYYDNTRNIIYLLSSNSDGAGSYEIIWKIENGVYKERLVARGF